MNGYMIEVSRVDSGKVEESTKYFVSDTELKQLGDNVGRKVLESKLNLALNDLDFDHIWR